MIPEKLRDNTTIIKNHTLKTHIFCVLLRIAIGLSIITDKLPTKIIIIVADAKNRKFRKSKLMRFS